MLDDAVAAFLEQVGEREFDEPLLALIRRQGFEKVTFTHGAREFGKDIVARRDGEQWAWQSKAGNIGQGGWQKIVGQLDEMRLVNLGHGSYDVQLPRRPVLVITGRLVGNAPELYRDYNARAAAKGEPTLELWDHDKLLSLFLNEADAVLRGAVDGPFLGMISSIDGRTVSMQSIQQFARRWYEWPQGQLRTQGVVEAALLAQRLASSRRLDLAAQMALCLFATATVHRREGQTDANETAEAGEALFVAYATQLWDACDERHLQPKRMANRSGFSSWATYPVRATRIAEILGLLRLWHLENGDESNGVEVGEWVCKFVEVHRGAAHPISDNYAVGLIPAAIVLAMHDPEAASAFLVTCAIWLCDRHEPGRLGLGSVGTAPHEELVRLLSSSSESDSVASRRASYTAVVLLDLASRLSPSTTYADILNDVRATRINPEMLRIGDVGGAYSRAHSSHRVDPNVDFARSLSERDVIAPHHTDVNGIATNGAGGAWTLLAVSSALRDRHFYSALVALTPPGPTND